MTAVSSSLTFGDTQTLKYSVLFQENADNITFLSGNPGYQEGRDLLFQISNKALPFPKDVSLASGNCFSASDFLEPDIDPIKFGASNLDYCSRTANLSSFCTSSSSDPIFNQIQGIQQFGKDIHDLTSQDTSFIPLVDQPPASSPSWDATTGTCSNMITGYRYQLMYSQAGFYDNLQTYIVGIKRTPLQTTVTHPSFTTSNKTIDLTVAFGYLELVAEEIREDDFKTFDFPPQIGSDLIVPLTFH